ncbi:MAG: TerC/Alx family metal homeostasis membrane protein [Chloracidobacterium sp.]|nr:TerC/Alx family metal homeostasis membrane protein [Chloracidobacterium sp.]
MTIVEFPYWVWISFFALVLAALFVDIGIVNRKSHKPTRKETFVWSFIWVSLALIFNGFVYWFVNSTYGPAAAAIKAKEFFTGYLVEMSLSIDNLFVFLLIFSYFKVAEKYRHRVLFWGIFMALVMRMVMIFAGVELVESFHWVLYLFGAFLIYTGLKMFGEDESFEPEDSAIVRLTTKFVRISKHYDKEKFFVVVDGKRTGTLLLLVLIVINVADLVFAVDSIPAILGITTDRFIVYTSNIFAILGLRTFFFLLADLADRFHFLKYGLAFVLSFIGIKMLLPLAAHASVLLLGAEDQGAFSVVVRRYLNHEFEQPVINISLGIVVGAIVVAVILSLIFPHKHPADDAEPETE